MWVARRQEGSSSEGWPTPETPDGSGDVAQLGERLPCTEKVTGSSPVVSTRSRRTGVSPAARRRRLRSRGSGLGAGTRSRTDVFLVLASSLERRTRRSGHVYLDNCIASARRCSASCGMRGCRDEETCVEALRFARLIDASYQGRTVDALVLRAEEGRR